MKLYEVLNLNEIMKKVIDDQTLKIDSLTKFKLLGIMKVLEPHIQNFEIIRNEKIKEFGKEDGDGNVLIGKEDTDAMRQFNDSLSDIINSDLNITFEKIKANEKLSSGISKIMALAESYPDLKANENFKDLSNQLSKIEDEIASSRKYYNATVRDFNNKVEMFPSNIFAKLLGYKTRNMFEANEEERQNVKVSL